MPEFKLDEAETWQFRALNERRTRAQLAMELARQAYERASQDLQRAKQAINEALLAASKKRKGPQQVEKLSVDLPSDDNGVGTIRWEEEEKEVRK